MNKECASYTVKSELPNSVSLSVCLSLSLTHTHAFKQLLTMEKVSWYARVIICYVDAKSFVWQFDIQKYKG